MGITYPNSKDSRNVLKVFPTEFLFFINVIFSQLQKVSSISRNRIGKEKKVNRVLGMRYSARVLAGQIEVFKRNDDVKHDTYF